MFTSLLFAAACVNLPKGIVSTVATPSLMSTVGGLSDKRDDQYFGFLLDSGAARHVCGRAAKFMNLCIEMT